ncbi:hypothetical protein, partial [Burkholderia vietnamiensis]|uniref:hypothetical protein n=1 Tax=Burkholderia vietnamiensis TaxID=60552 RepID=UPI002658A0FE
MSAVFTGLSAAGFFLRFGAAAPVAAAPASSPSPAAAASACCAAAGCASRYDGGVRGLAGV